MIIPFLLFLPALCLLPSPGIAQNPGVSFRQGNEAYIQGDYEAALEAYAQAESSGMASGALYFNLGNTHYKLDHIGKAILYYERARKFLADDPDLEVNLRLANMRVADRITPVPEIVHVRLWNQWTHLLGPRLWTQAFQGTFLLLGLLISGRLLTRRRVWRRVMNRLITAALLATALTTATMWQSWHNRHREDAAVIMVDKVEVRAAPNDDGVELFSLHEGTRVRLLRASAGWREVRLADGNVGWIPTDTVEII